mmetsp:Transcript_9310/g.25163  ORF Transcript_9310/g.25163 Transcript_9310/m.25163 type:complete len:238 (+) Transcript_9310:1085-1798(+)
MTPRMILSFESFAAWSSNLSPRCLSSLVTLSPSARRTATSFELTASSVARSFLMSIAMLLDVNSTKFSGRDPWCEFQAWLAPISRMSSLSVLGVIDVTNSSTPSTMMIRETLRNSSIVGLLFINEAVSECSPYLSRSCCGVAPSCLARPETPSTPPLAHMLGRMVDMHADRSARSFMPSRSASSTRRSVFLGSLGPRISRSESFCRSMSLRGCPLDAAIPSRLCAAKAATTKSFDSR